MEERTYLIELQLRPDGQINSAISTYSTPTTTLAMYYQRCAAAVSSTQFTSVTLMIVDLEGRLVQSIKLKTSYVPPEPEPEEDPE